MRNVHVTRINAVTRRVILDQLQEARCFKSSLNYASLCDCAIFVLLKSALVINICKHNVFVFLFIRVLLK